MHKRSAKIAKIFKILTVNDKHIRTNSSLGVTAEKKEAHTKIIKCHGRGLTMAMMGILIGRRVK